MPSGVGINPTLVEQTRQAARRVVASWATDQRLVGNPLMLLNAVALDERGNETREVFSLQRLRTSLVQGRRFVLEGPAGCGKTTTLIQLAEADADLQSVPVLIDLPDWMDSENGILDYVARNPVFRNSRIDATVLANVSQSETLVFLINGWNEVSRLHFERAGRNLRALARDYPSAGIIVASRTRCSLPGSTRIRLQGVTATQRLEYLEGLLEARQASGLNSKLVNDRTLDELTRTPFVLAELAAVYRSRGDLPRTRLGLLEQVINLTEQVDPHRDPLQAEPLQGRAEEYLRSLALELATRGKVLLGDAEARVVCRSASERLKNAGQIEEVSGSGAILDSLCCHHILERLDYSDTRFRFAHQQFQEYYSALVLRSRLMTVIKSEDLVQCEEFTRKYINEPAWEEPLRMLAEELGASDGDSATGQLLVRSAMEVDLIFAADLCRLCGSSIGSEVRRDLNERLRSWYAVSNHHHQRCALAAMLATSSDEFTDILLPLLTSPDEQIRNTTYRAGAYFHPSSLGPQWRQVVANWPEPMRIEFVSELANHYGYRDVASAFAHSDPSEAVRLAAIEALAWVGESSAVAEILNSLEETEFRQALQRLEADLCPPSVRPRAIRSFKSLLAATSDPKVRCQIALTLAELDDAGATLLLKDELASLPSEAVTALGDHALRPAMEIVRRVDPQWVEEWVSARMSDAVLWGESWISLVSRVPESLSEWLLRRISTEVLSPAVRGSIIAMLTAVADAELASAIFRRLCDQRQQLSADEGNQEKQTIDLQLTYLFKALPPAVVVKGLSDLLQRTLQVRELCIVIEVFGSLGSESVNLRSMLPEHMRRQLRHYLKAAVPEASGGSSLRGETKARLALALADVGEPDDVDDLLALIRDDIERVEKWRAAIERGDRTTGNLAVWSIWYVRALVRLDHARAETALISLLQEPEYEEAAANALRILAQVEIDHRSIVSGCGYWPPRDYRKVRRNPSASPFFDEGRRVKCAAALKQRILALMLERKDAALDAGPYNLRLKELGKVLAALDPQQSADLIWEIAALPETRDGWSNVALIEALAFGGVRLPLDRVMRILDPIIVRLRAHGIYGDGNLLVNLLCILPFVDPPALGIERIRELRSEFRLQLYNAANLQMALGQCGCEDGVALLRDLAAQEKRIFQDNAKPWIEAVAACPLPSARSLLLSFIDPQAGAELGEVDVPEHASRLLAFRISDLARTDAALTERILRLTSETVSPKQRPTLARVIAALDVPQALLAGLDLIEDGSPQPLPFEFWKAIEDLFLERCPFENSPQSFTRVPRAADDIRKRLLEMTEQDPRRARSAYDLLGQIEVWRLEYGRPRLELRHPAYESGKPWPPLAPDGGEASAPSLSRATHEAAGESGVLGVGGSMGRSSEEKTEISVSPSSDGEAANVRVMKETSIPGANGPDHSFDLTSQAGRSDAVAAYTKYWSNCSQAGLARTARVDPADLSKWKRGSLPAESDKKTRIENALKKNDPPTPAAKRQTDL